MKGITYIILCSTTLFGAFSFPVQAQEFSLGVKAGPLITRSVFADKFDNDEFTHKIKFGYLGAGLINFPMKDNYSFQTELGFSQRGRKIKDKTNEPQWINTGTYYFGDASMMLRRSFAFQLGKNIPSKWFINIGPHISYWIGGKGKIKIEATSEYKIVFDSLRAPAPGAPPDFDKMYYAGVNRWLFGVDIGVGFVAPLWRSQKILAELRFTSGHTFYGDKASAKWRTLNFHDNLRSNEKVLSITAAYIFEFNLKEGRMGHSTLDKVKKKPKKKK